MLRWLLQVAPLLFHSLQVTSAAYCGTSTIPFSLEILPDLSTVLGCARPRTGCYGWEPLSGDPASTDEQFQTGPTGQPDGFLRTGDPRILPFLQQQPQTSVCMAAGFGGCQQDQWVGGMFRQPDGGISMTCCTYPPLFNSEDRGTASLHRGEIFIGGEMDQNTFDYVQNVTEVRGADGEVDHYDVHVRRFSCIPPQPMPTPQQLTAMAPPPIQQVYQPAAVPQAPYGGNNYYYPAGTGGYSQMQCFAADSTVRLQTGEIVRMDELDMNSWIKSPNWNNGVKINVPLSGWLHREPEEKAEFLVIFTESGKQLKITHDHYIHRADCNLNGSTPSTEQIIAGDLSVGDCLMEESEGTESLSVIPIVSIDKVMEKGIYAPLSDKGNLMVNGIAVSCHSQYEDNTLIQTFFSKIITCKEADRSVRCNFEKSYVELLIQMMRLVVPTSGFF